MKKVPIDVFTIFTVVLMLIFSCANLNDTVVDLGDGYTYCTDNTWRKIIPASTYCNTEIYSEVTAYAYNGNFIVAKQNPDYDHYKIFVGSDLGSRYSVYTNYLKDTAAKDFDGMHAIIKADSALYKRLKSDGVTDSNSARDQKIIALVVDTIFRNDPFYVRLLAAKENYWIIEKKKNKRIGPLNKLEFEKSCSTLGINLQVK